MPEKKETSTGTGRLLYNGQHNYLELDGYVLRSGDNVEVRILGSWIPGEIASDPGGWYLFTIDNVGIRLRTGLPARFCIPRFSDAFSWPAAKVGPPHVLIVDDDPTLLEALPRTIRLRISLAQVNVSASMEEALKLLQEQRFDAIVSDIKMPGMDGLALLAKVQELQPGTPVLLITGHSDHNLAIRALRGGAFDYILKPIERDDFIATLERALQISLLRQQVEEQQHALELHAQLLEQQVQQRTQELMEANVTKDRIIGLVTRELRPPLVRLKEMAQLLRQKLVNAEAEALVSKDFADVEHVIEHIEGLVEELLRTSRIESRVFIAQRQQCDVVELCRMLLEEQVRNHHLQLVCNFVKMSMMVEVDVEQLRQVIALLLPYMQSSVRPDHHLTVTLQQAGSEAIIVVRDLRPNIGLGIGLYVSRKILERHGGRLEVQDFPDNRSTIFLMLPRIAATGEEREEAGEPHTYAMWTISRGEEMYGDGQRHKDMSSMPD